MILNLILVFVSIALGAIVTLLTRRLNAWLAFGLISALLFALGIAAVGVAVSTERFSNYSNYTARYLEYSRELKAIAEKSEFERLRDAIVYFDTKVQSDSQSPDTLANDVQAIRTGDFMKQTVIQAEDVIP